MNKELPLYVNNLNLPTRACSCFCENYYYLYNAQQVAKNHNFTTITMTKQNWKKYIASRQAYESLNFPHTRELVTRAYGCYCCYTTTQGLALFFKPCGPDETVWSMVFMPAINT